MYLYVCKTMHVCNCVCMNMYACMHPLPPTSLPVSTPNIIHHRRLTVFPSDSLGLTRCYRFCFGLAPVNKLVPATLLFLGAVEISSLRLRLRSCMDLCMHTYTFIKFVMNSFSPSSISEPISRSHDGNISADL